MCRTSSIVLSVALTCLTAATSPAVATRATAVLAAQTTPPSVSTSTATIDRNMTRFFEAWTGRQLTTLERETVVAEMVAFHGDPSRAATAAESFHASTERLLTDVGRASAQWLRKELLVANHFHDRVGTQSRALIYEPDPPRVSDPEHLRVLSEADLVALVRLRSFVLTGQPVAVPVSSTERARLGSELSEVYPKTGELPQIYHEASVLWLGLTEHWPTWSPTERDLARRFVDRGFEIDLTPLLYQQLLGLNPVEATARQRDDLRNQTRHLMGGLPAMSTPNAQLDEAIRRARTP